VVGGGTGTSIERGYETTMERAVGTRYRDGGGNRERKGGMDVARKAFWGGVAWVMVVMGRGRGRIACSQ